MSNPRKMSPNELVKRVEGLEREQDKAALGLRIITQRYDALAAELEAVKASRERFRQALLIAQGDAEPGDFEPFQPLRDSDWGDLAAPDAEGEARS